MGGAGETPTLPGWCSPLNKCDAIYGSCLGVDFKKRVNGIGPLARCRRAFECRPTAVFWFSTWTPTSTWAGAWTEAKMKISFKYSLGNTSADSDHLVRSKSRSESTLWSGIGNRAKHGNSAALGETPASQYQEIPGSTSSARDLCSVFFLDDAETMLP